MISSVGVVVPAHNEERLLASCLSALRDAADEVPAARGLGVHMVVVADACRDRTAQVARDSGVRVITISAGCAGAARAAGFRDILRQAGHREPGKVWLATTDADTVVPGCWPEQQLRYAEEGWDAVAGTVEVADWSGRPAAVQAVFAGLYGDGTGPHPHGANLGFRASAYLAAGGFPELPVAEDHALVTALVTAGSRVLRTRALPVVTSGRRRGRVPSGFAGYLNDLQAHPGAPASREAAGPASRRRQAACLARTATGACCRTPPRMNCR